jgi:hypothetical protein
MAGCGHCGAKLPVVGNQVGRRDSCDACGGELHSCLCCRHYDPAVAKACKEPFAEVPDDKEGANFCEFFQIGDGRPDGRRNRDEMVNAAEALFKKG